MGKRSLAKPGSMPVVKHDAPPASQASVIGAIQSGGLSVIAGQTHGVIAVEHTSMPGTKEGADVPDVVAPGAPPSVRSGPGRRAQGRRGPATSSVAARPMRIEAADLPDVLSHLRRVADADAHELERRVPEDLGDHHPADEAGAPDHDSLGHLVLPLLSSPGSKTHSRASSSGMKGRSGPFSTRNPVITALEAQEAPVNETDERLTLPLLPLATGVVLPQMVVTLALETDEAKAAADAGIGGDGQLLLVPRVDGRYARVGTIARVESSGELPNGVRALVLRGVQRAVVGVGVAGTSAGLWVEAEPVDDSGEPTERVARAGARLPGHRGRHRRASRRRPPARSAARRHRPRRAGRHRRLVARPGSRAQARAARDARRRGAAGEGRRLGARRARRARRRREDPLRGHRRHGASTA